MSTASSMDQLGKERLYDSAPIHVASPCKHLLWLALAVVCAGSMLFFVDQIWSPGKSMHLSDLHARWYGARELLRHSRDPYSPAVTREIQLWRYGYVLDGASTHSQFHDEARFAYPLYIVFVLWPLIWFSFPQTYRILQIVLPAMSLATVALWIRAMTWKPGRFFFTCAVILGIGNFPVLEDIYLQQPVLLAAFFMAAAFAALSAGRLYAAGALLALATIKPQVSVPVVLWLVFWACSNWRARKNLVIGFFAAMSVLIGAAEFLLPRWSLEFVAGLAAYQHYTGMVSILTIMFGRIASVIITLGSLLAGACLAVQTRDAEVGSSKFSFTFSILLAITLVTAPTLYPTGQIVLIPVILLLSKNSAQLWAQGRWIRLLFVSVLILITWPWIASVGLLVLRIAIPLQKLRSMWIAVVAPVMLVPLSLVALLGAVAYRFLRHASKLEPDPVLEQS